MDLAPLPVSGSHSHDHTVGHQLPSADSPPTVFSTSAPRQRTVDLLGKVIGQRQVDRCDTGLDTEYSGAQEFAARLYIYSADDEHVDVADRPHGQQTPEQDDGGSSWQVVTRRRSGCKQQKSAGAAPARGKNSARANSAPASHLPENSSAGSGVIRQQRRQGAGPLLPSTSCLFWSSCINSFARLSEVDWTSFRTCLMKFDQFPKTGVIRDDFLRFHHLMTKGPQAIRSEDDAVFLVGPLKVLMSENAWSSDAVLLSLALERVVPGFLSMLGDRFVYSLTGINRRHDKLFRAITKLLSQICQEDEGWLNRLGWQKLPLRGQCCLFSSLTFLFKQSNEKDLIRNLQQQVSGAWLEEQYYATVQRISCDTVHRDLKGYLLDLRANVRAVFSWLEAQIFSVGKPQEQPELIARYADVCDALLVAVDSIASPPSALLFGLWLAVAQWLHRFRMHLSHCLGFDRAISLLDKLLKKIDRWPYLAPLVFELRLCLLGFLLTKCEELTFRRNAVLFSQAWNEYEKKLKLLLAECRRFMNDYQPPFAADDEAHYARLKEETRLSLMLKESVFYRLDCEICRSSRQCIQENLQVCRIAFNGGWALDQNYREVGTIELAKWYFLAGKYEAGVSTLTNACFKHVKLSTKKANLLARHGMYHAAVAEFHHTKALMRESGETDRRKRDKVDNRIAMAQLQRYQAGGGTDHLIEAYRLSVDLLGRCDVRDRDDFEGVLSHIVNAMKPSGLRFEDFAGQTSVLGYLRKDGSGFKSWDHFADLLYVRHKVGLTDVDTVDKVANELNGKYRCSVDPGKKA